MDEKRTEAGIRKPPGIMIYISVYSSFRPVLTLEQKGILLDTLTEYHQTGEIPDFSGDPVLQAAVNVFLSDIRRDEEKYTAMCERNAYIARTRRRPSGLPPVTSRDESSPVGTNINSNSNSNINGNSNTEDIGPTAKADGQRQRPRSTPPTLEEVREECQAKGYTVNPEAFFDYYTSNGWKVGKNPMKDWKAALRTWQRKEQEGGGKNGSSRTRPADKVPGQRDLYE